MTSATHYVDVTGRAWPVAKLDALLADPEVLQTVREGASFGLCHDRTWLPSLVQEWVGWRYIRDEPAALLLLLVTRFFDTEGAHFLERERSP